MDLCTVYGATSWFYCFHGKPRTELASCKVGSTAQLFAWSHGIMLWKAWQDDRPRRRESNPRPLKYGTRRLDVPTVAFGNEVREWTFVSAILCACSIRRILHSPACSYSPVHTILHAYTTFMNAQPGEGNFICIKTRTVYIAFLRPAFPAHYTAIRVKNCVQYTTHSLRSNK
jgi:hypothetical protein